MSIETGGPATHSVIGCIHELMPQDDSPEALERVLRHECDECDGVRVVVDLTNRAALDNRHVQIMVEAMDPHQERWTIWLPDDVDPTVVEELHRAGFEGRIQAERLG